MKLQHVNRTGSVAVFLCFLMLPLLALLAFSVDYGFLLYIRTDMQRTADQASVAAVRDLIPDANGQQDLAQARATVREYVARNLGNNFTVRDSDIEIGRFEPNTIYDSVNILDNGVFDTVRVTLRHDDLANSSISLYFARLLDIDQADVATTATAVLQRARYLPRGADVLPIGVEERVWDTVSVNGVFSIYGDGKIKDGNGNNIPGNWGTLDIGANANSTSDIRFNPGDGIDPNFDFSGNIDVDYIEERLGDINLDKLWKQETRV